MQKRKTYRYVLTLDVAVWPRKIVDELSFAPYIFAHLVSVTDLQRKDHVYGDTYTVQK